MFYANSCQKNMSVYTLFKVEKTESDLYSRALEV